MQLVSLELRIQCLKGIFCHQGWGGVCARPKSCGHISISNSPYNWYIFTSKVTIIIIIYKYLVQYNAQNIVFDVRTNLPKSGPLWRGVKVTLYVFPYFGSFAGKFRTVSGLWYLKGMLGNFLLAPNYLAKSELARLWACSKKSSSSAYV